MQKIFLQGWLYSEFRQSIFQPDLLISWWTFGSLKHVSTKNSWYPVSTSRFFPNMNVKEPYNLSISWKMCIEVESFSVTEKCSGHLLYISSIWEVIMHGVKLKLLKFCSIYSKCFVCLKCWTNFFSSLCPNFPWTWCTPVKVSGHHCWSSLLGCCWKLKIWRENFSCNICSNQHCKRQN